MVGRRSPRARAHLGVAGEEGEAGRRGLRHHPHLLPERRSAEVDAGRPATMSRRSGAPRRPARGTCCPPSHPSRRPEALGLLGERDAEWRRAAPEPGTSVRAPGVSGRDRRIEERLVAAISAIRSGSTRTRTRRRSSGSASRRTNPARSSRSRTPVTAPLVSPRVGETRRGEVRLLGDQLEAPKVGRVDAQGGRHGLVRGDRARDEAAYGVGGVDIVIGYRSSCRYLSI